MKRDSISLDEYRMLTGTPLVACGSSKPRNDEEHHQQSAFFDWAHSMEANLKELALLYAIPNGGHRHIATAAKLKAEGVKAGCPDVNLDVARGGYHGLRIEFKAGKNKQTEKQKAWFRHLVAHGYYCAVCYSWVEAKNITMTYLAEIAPPMDFK